MWLKREKDRCGHREVKTWDNLKGKGELKTGGQVLRHDGASSRWGVTEQTPPINPVQVQEMALAVTPGEVGKAGT